MFKKIIGPAVAAATLSVLSSQASATVTVYTSQAAYAAALSSSTTETFDSSTLTSGLSFISDAGSVGGGVFNDRLVLGEATTTFSFGGNVNGFGGVFDETPGGFGQNIAFTLTLADGSTLRVSQTLDNANAGTFFGFISTDAFRSVLLTGATTANGGSAETYNVDNIQFGVTSVPEPGSVALMLAGLGLVGAAARRRAGK